MQYYLLNIPPKLHHWQSRKLHVTQSHIHCQQKKQAHVIFGIQFGCCQSTW